MSPARRTHVDSLQPPSPSPSSEPLIELRQYTLHPGRRDALIDLFEREFIASQAACGIQVLGQFRDLDRPDHFVWLRGFPGLEQRRQSLAAFYGGPVWKAHRAAANATMIDSDDVLLLRAAHADIGFDEMRRPAPVRERRPSCVLVTLFSLPTVPDTPLLAAFRRTQQSADAAAGARTLGGFMTDMGPNTFPALPVREGEHVLVWFSRFDDLHVIERDGWVQADALARREALEAHAGTCLEAGTHALRLMPTERSRIR